MYLASEADLEFLKGEGQAKMWGKRRKIFGKFGAIFARSVLHLDHFSKRCAPRGPLFHGICPSLAIFYV